MINDNTFTNNHDITINESKIKDISSYSNHKKLDDYTEIYNR